MSRDRRGFEYALEPMRSVTEWDMKDAACELSAQNAAVDTQQDKVGQLSNLIDAARAYVIEQRQVNARLNVDAQCMAHAYLVQAYQRLATESAQLHSLRQVRDDTFARLNVLRKFADSLERDKEAAADEYDQKIAKQAYQQADDGWLQRLHWRKTS